MSLNQSITLLISGEAYTEDENSNLTKVTDQLRTTVQNKINSIAKIQQETAPIRVNNVNILEAIGTGFVSIVDYHNYIYVREGIINMPFIGKDETVPVSIPRTLVISEKGVIYAATLVDERNPRVYPFSNAFAPKDVVIPGIGNVPMSNLCLGSKLESLFAESPIKRVPELVETIFTSAPNDDLELRAHFSSTKFSDLIARCINQGTINKIEWDIMRVRMKTSFQRWTSTYDYNNLLTIASIFTSIKPELTNEFWRDVIVDSEGEINMDELKNILDRG